LVYQNIDKGWVLASERPAALTDLVFRAVPKKLNKAEFLGAPIPFAFKTLIKAEFFEAAG